MEWKKGKWKVEATRNGEETEEEKRLMRERDGKRTIGTE